MAIPDMSVKALTADSKKNGRNIKRMRGLSLGVKR
jgi:hypothetical protein